MVTTFFVAGTPQPQGSARAFVVNGRAVVTSANKNLAQWRQLVSLKAQDHAKMYGGAVEVEVMFFFVRPKSLPKKVTAHTKRPDVDKCLRAILDSLTGIMWKDDSQVIDAHVGKRYATNTMNPGVRICIRDAT